jgi:hypothetical protein
MTHYTTIIKKKVPSDDMRTHFFAKEVTEEAFFEAEVVFFLKKKTRIFIKPPTHKTRICYMYM